MIEDYFESVLDRIENAAKHQSDNLQLGFLNLTELPESIGQLTQLKILDLTGNQLTKLPESIGQLKQLQRLGLDSNHLTELPESIGRLAQLKVLNLYRNRVMKLPESISQLKQLEELELSENQLTELPESIDQLTQLKVLNLTRNRLVNLPESISRLTQLQDLYLGGNQLTEIPESITQLIQLKAFFIWGNQLTELTESICRLTHLEALHVSGNRLTELPRCLTQLKDIKKLFLQDIPKLGLPTELLGTIDQIVGGDKNLNHNPQEILDFYFRVRENGRPLNEAKLILVGRGAVGKTSLVNRLIHNKFNPVETKTPGIKIDKWEIDLDGSEKVNLNVWDFGGQEIMHATHQFFLTERSLYLLVLNGRDGAEDLEAEYWLKLIDSFGGKSPVIVVLNKIAEHNFDLNRGLLLQKYPNIREFVKTDCGDGSGVEELYRLIKRETDALDELRVGFPSEWFAVKDRLANMKENYLRFEKYREICSENEVVNRQHQEMLARYLNQLGIVLNFKDDARLRDTHVLNPHWVTEGIYMLLNATYLIEREGDIRLDEVSGVLPEEVYPSEMHRFIFDLMKKFSLCFSFPEDECHYLIPELLSKEQPAEAKQFVPGECLNFQYHYTILPEGILPRFIVRTNILSRDLPRWRSGVILEFEGCRALVKADIADKRVSISISGEKAESRRRLLAVIRSDFDRIHNEIRNLNVEPMVPLHDHPEKAVSYNDLLVMEKENMLDYKTVVDGKVITEKVRDLLNGVDLEGIKGETVAGREREPVNLFYSYAHKDDVLRSELETHLKILKQSKLISSFHEGQIDAGDEPEKEIDRNLESADIILLLVSPDYFNSPQCEKQIAYALERHKKGEAVVIPVIIRKAIWESAPFGKLKPLPENAEPVTSWADKDAAWYDVSKGIEKVAEKIHSEKNNRA